MGLVYGNNKTLFNKGIFHSFQVLVFALLDVAFALVVGDVCTLFCLYDVVVANLN